ncbi:MAG TPA: vitamin K epoxide reductase family protein [Thermoanaerobaculia bacterium]|jgi:protein-disulfide isomerase/uncharacterized membrane protein|nr:vitamin K epoxide reductase family protein [Thermoanaerobaculia bacterium]
MSERQESARPRLAAGQDRRVAVVVVLAVLGAWISLTLTRFHLSAGQSGPGLFRTVCEITGGGCDHVLQSPWATLPRNIPLSLAGLVYFSALALWYLIIGRPNRDGLSWYLPIFTLQLVGAFFSVFLIGVMLFQVHAVCGWCALVHVINLTLAWLAWKLWPRDRADSGPAWPPARLGFAALLLVVFVAMYWNQWLLNNYLEAETASFTGDADLMRYLHLRNAVQQVPVRADDPARGLATAPHTVVVFSDFLCPACRSFAGFFKSDIQPLHGGQMRLVYKYFPLDAACNPKLPLSVHPGACDAAYAAEAARELGGPEAFWKMHDALFEHQEDARAGRWAELARSAGLDGAAVADRIAKHSHADRVAEDVQLGMSLKLKGTPSVFVDGRTLDEWNNPDLWKAILAPPPAPH